jgi:hypothetical protein
MERTMTVQQNILVPVGSSDTDFNSVNYALALAARIQAQVHILRHGTGGRPANSMAMRREKALPDLINSARTEGLTISDHIAHQELEKEIVGLIRDESIDILVFGTGNGTCERLMLQIKAVFRGRIIQVKEKNHISYL